MTAFSLKEKIKPSLKTGGMHELADVYLEELKEKGIYKGSIRRMLQVVSALRQRHNKTKKASFLPLEFPLGSALQIDHGEFEAEIDRQRVKGYVFVASVPGQVLRYCQIFPTKASEAWGEFHERTFAFFGGVFPRVIYDNDTVLVKKIIGSEREQTSFSMGLEEHYGFESHFCNAAAGNESDLFLDDHSSIRTTPSLARDETELHANLSSDTSMETSSTVAAAARPTSITVTIAADY